MDKAGANPARQMQLLEAAGTLFRTRGFRAVTMETVAAEAGVAKATLYAYFPDKTALFVAAADEAARRIAAALIGALNGPGTVDERLVGGMVARHALTFELVDGSPFAHELMGAKHSLARAAVDVHDKQMFAALEAVIREDPQLAPQATRLARLTFEVCIGLSACASTAERLSEDIAFWLRAFLTGIRVQSGPAANPTRLKGAR